MFLELLSHIVEIFEVCLLRRTFRTDKSLVYPYRAVAYLLDLTERVRNNDDSRTLSLYLLELVEALRLKVSVADGKYLVDEKNIRVNVYRYGESKTHIHTRRVGPYRVVDELLKLGEVHDVL